jgi:hypothetical protein
MFLLVSEAVSELIHKYYTKIKKKEEEKEDVLKVIQR